MAAATPRTIRIPDEVWTEVAALASLHDRSTAQEVTAALRVYCAKAGRPVVSRRGSPTP